MLAVKERTSKAHFKIKLSKSAYFNIVEQLPEATEVRFENATWNDYEKLLDEVGEASGLRLSFNKGDLRVMTLSVLHENYSALVQTLVMHLSFHNKIKVLCYKSATIKVSKVLKGAEPNGCFYVQSADTLPDKLRIDFNNDPMPDIVLEIDIHHDSKAKFDIYSAFGINEIWRYDGKVFELYARQKNGEYKQSKKSKALPILTAKILTALLNQSETKDQYEILLGFDEWLKLQK